MEIKQHESFDVIVQFLFGLNMREIKIRSFLQQRVIDQSSGRNFLSKKTTSYLPEKSCVLCVHRNSLPFLEVYTTEATRVRNLKNIGSVSYKTVGFCFGAGYQSNNDGIKSVKEEDVAHHMPQNVYDLFDCSFISRALENDRTFIVGFKDPYRKTLEFTALTSNDCDDWIDTLTRELSDLRCLPDPLDIKDIPIDLMPQDNIYVALPVVSNHDHHVHTDQNELLVSADSPGWMTNLLIQPSIILSALALVYSSLLLFEVNEIQKK
uniref:PH domain-containing protein n=1 Tax=Romanomermis culicivorax TaxID=13658 RepID=A0A915JHS7_ROMCU